MANQPIVVLITAPSREVGLRIARLLVEQKLAACVNLIPSISSVYSWKGEIQEDEEVLLLVKTQAELFSGQLVPAVCSLHPYELPELIALPVQDGWQPYLDWIIDSTRNRDG